MQSRCKAAFECVPTAKIEEQEAMSTNFGRESAKIYPFPARGVASGDARRPKSKSVVETKSVQYPEVSFGGCWYHEAAIRETDRTPKI